MDAGTILFLGIALVVAIFIILGRKGRKAPRRTGSPAPHFDNNVDGGDDNTGDDSNDDDD